MITGYLNLNLNNSLLIQKKNEILMTEQDNL